MGRTQRALTSLVAAIPAGFLCYLLVMVFLNRADSLKTMTQVVAGLTLLLAAIVTLMPFGLLIFGGKKAMSDEGRKTRGAPADDDGEVEEADVVDEGDEYDESEEAAEELADSSAFDMDDDEDVDVMSDSNNDFDSDGDSGATLDEDDAVEFEDEDDDEPTPRKKKK